MQRALQEKSGLKMELIDEKKVLSLTTIDQSLAFRILETSYRETLLSLLQVEL